jgi:hypothetical protein
VTTGDFLPNKTTSCGCKHHNELVARNTKHGHSIRKDRSSLYSSWAGMLQRCHNPNTEFYHIYGGKGVKVFPGWEDFTMFMQWALSHGWEEGLTIDRIDPDGDYCPENCQWLTKSEHSRKTNIQRKDKNGYNLY